MIAGRRSFVSLLLCMAGLAGLMVAVTASAQGGLQLTSVDFANGAPIPAKHEGNSFGCSGQNLPPTLSWTGMPRRTRSFALTVVDPDAPAPGGFVHWVVYNISASRHSIGPGTLHGTTPGKNGAGATTYFGPCPPTGSGLHHYHFTLYALDLARLRPRGLTFNTLRQAIRGHILARATLIGTFQRSSLLEKAARAAAGPVPYSGTSEIISSSTPVNLPVSTSEDVGRNHTVMTWAVADATHFRIDAQVLEPALESQTSVMVANGSSLIWYRDISATAIRAAIGSPTPAALLVGTILPLSGQVRSVQDLLDAYNRQSGIHATLIGQEQIVGRTAYVIEVRPVVRGQWSGCTTDKSGKQRCGTHHYAYGRNRLWIDHEHVVLLQSRRYDIPPDFGGESLYRVTSITFGQGPTSAQLAYEPPVTVKDAPVNGWGASSGSSLGGGSQWQAPKGFIPAGAPTGPGGRQYIAVSESQRFDPPGNHPSEVSVVYAARRSPTPQSPPTGPQRSRLKGPYVYVQERKRKNGPPPLFGTGAQHMAGTCAVWTGRYPDGIRWLGLTRGDVSLEATTNKLSQTALVRYAATKICA